VKQQIFPVQFEDDQFVKPKDEVKDEIGGDNDDDLDELDLTEMCIRSYIEGCYSPTLLQINELNAGVMVLQEDEDYRRLEYRRNQVIGTGKINSVDIDEEFEKKARETTMLDIDMDEQNVDDGAEASESKSSKATEKNSEESIKAEEILIERQYLWSDKYRPRKPRYFNRVHTGFDWNQYNKKHYDMDNPPPKTVAGYKFNVNKILKSQIFQSEIKPVFFNFRYSTRI
jgi:hypothetical protein